MQHSNHLTEDVIDRKILDDAFETWYGGPTAKGMVEVS